MQKRWSGCGTALVTPFTDTGEVDEAAVTRLARRQIDGGVHFLVPCGTTGESPTLSVSEKLRIVELVANEAAGRVPVLAGAGGYDTNQVVTLAQEMVRCGADGILSVTPYYNKPSREGLYAHFRTIAEAVDRPIIVYNVPGRTGCNVDPATLLRLASVDNIVGVKEASARVPDVLGGEKDPVSKERKERPGRDQTGNREHAESRQRPDADVHVLELRDPGAVKRHGIQAFQVLGAGEVPVPRIEEFADVLPDGVLFIGVGDRWGRVSAGVVAGEPGDGVSASPIDGIPKTRMVRVKRDELRAPLRQGPRLVREGVR